MTRINTGTGALNRDIQMWLLEYRLLPENINKEVLAGRMENGWITQWESTGLPLLVQGRNRDSEGEIWRRVGVIYTPV